MTMPRLCLDKGKVRFGRSIPPENRLMLSIVFVLHGFSLNILVGQWEREAKKDRALCLLTRRVSALLCLSLLFSFVFSSALLYQYVKPAPTRPNFDPSHWMPEHKRNRSDFTLSVAMSTTLPVHSKEHATKVWNFYYIGTSNQFHWVRIVSYVAREV